MKAYSLQDFRQFPFVSLSVYRHKKSVNFSFTDYYSALERNSTYLKCTKYIYGKSPRLRMSILAFSLVHFYVLKKVSSFLKSTSLKQNAILCICHCIALPMRGYAIGRVISRCLLFVFCLVCGAAFSLCAAKLIHFTKLCKSC